jgi:hypothetical protein
VLEIAEALYRIVNTKLTRRARGPKDSAGWVLEREISSRWISNVATFCSNSIGELIGLCEPLSKV